jgi:hypothetical protein
LLFKFQKCSSPFVEFVWVLTGLGNRRYAMPNLGVYLDIFSYYLSIHDVLSVGPIVALARK